MFQPRIDQVPHGLRRHIYVDSELQGAVLVRILFYWLSMFGLITIGLSGGVILRNPWMDAPKLFCSVIYDHRILYLAMIFTLRLQIGDALRLTHRVAGPMYRVRRHLAHVLEGREVPQLQLRRNDFWHDVAGKINDLVARTDAISTLRPNMHARELSATPEQSY